MCSVMVWMNWLTVRIWYYTLVLECTAQISHTLLCKLELVLFINYERVKHDKTVFRINFWLEIKRFGIRLLMIV